MSRRERNKRLGEHWIVLRLHGADSFNFEGEKKFESQKELDKFYGKLAKLFFGKKKSSPSGVTE